MSLAMSRPPFKPDAYQGRLVRELARQAERLAADDVQFSLLMRTARQEGVPIEHIAKAAGVTVKTVYNRLARIEQRMAAESPRPNG